MPQDKRFHKEGLGPNFFIIRVCGMILYPVCDALGVELVGTLLLVAIHFEIIAGWFVVLYVSPFLFFKVPSLSIYTNN